MPEQLEPMLQAVATDPNRLYLAAGLALGVIVVAVLLRGPLTSWRENRQIAKVIRRLGTRRLRGLKLADGTGGEVTLDYLLLGRDRLVVVSLKRYGGLIFGGKNMDQWTQVINRVSYKFPNPDEYLRRQVNAVRALAPGVKVSGIHLFTHGARFPKDKPANVVTTRDLRQLPERPRHRDIPAGLQQAWQALADNLR
jgi:hypothetical protein